MSTFVLARIEAIQQELEDLKKVVSHQEHASAGRKTKLKGLWQGIQVSEKDILIFPSSIVYRRFYLPSSHFPWFCYANRIDFKS